jgi:hypothetical protein
MKSVHKIGDEKTPPGESTAVRCEHEAAMQRGRSNEDQSRRIHRDDFKGREEELAPAVLIALRTPGTMTAEVVHDHRTPRIVAARRFAGSTVLSLTPS